MCLAGALIGSLLFGFGLGGVYFDYHENTSFFSAVVGYIITIAAAFALSALAD